MSAKDLVNQVAAQNKALRAADSEAVSRVEPILSTALAGLRPMLQVVFNDNPSTGATTILDRPEVLSLIDQTVDPAVSQIKLQIRLASSAASSLGQRAATDQLAELGLVPGGVSPGLSQDYLDAVYSKLDNAGAQFKVDLRHRIIGSKARDITAAFDRSVTDLVHRAELGISAATKRSYADAAEQTYASAGELSSVEMGKMWVANYAAGHIPCPVCAALSGQVVAMDAEFVVPGHLKFKKFGKLTGPQAHPNCVCMLLPSPIGDTEAQEVATVKVPKLPTVVHSSDIRKMSPAKFSKLLAALLASLVSIVKRRKGNG